MQVLRSGVHHRARHRTRHALELPYVAQNYDVQGGRRAGHLRPRPGVPVWPSRWRVITKVNRDPASRWRRSRPCRWPASNPIVKCCSSGRADHPASTATASAGGRSSRNRSHELGPPRTALGRAFTVLIALVAQVVPLPDWLSVVRPSFIALVIIYWSIFAPMPAASSRPGWRACPGRVQGRGAGAERAGHRAGGLHRDEPASTLRNQTLIQQSLFVFAVLTLNEFVVWESRAGPTMPLRGAGSSR